MASVKSIPISSVLKQPRQDFSASSSPAGPQSECVVFLSRDDLVAQCEIKGDRLDVIDPKVEIGACGWIFRPAPTCGRLTVVVNGEKNLPKSSNMKPVMREEKIHPRWPFQTEEVENECGEFVLGNGAD